MADVNREDRTLPATPRRLEQAREEGQVARSRELSTALVLLGAAGAFWSVGPRLADQLLALMGAGLRLDRDTLFQSAGMTHQLLTLSWEGLIIVLPLLGVLLAAGIAAPLAIGGWMFSPKAFTPAWSRLNPMTGLGRILSTEGLFELFKAVLKAVLIGGIAAWLLWRSLDPIMGLAEQSLSDGMAEFVRLMIWALLILVGGLLLIALIDVPLQLYQHRSRLRMTLEEVKREAREMEGDPQLKARVRSQQREMARRRMMAEVPHADVVVTNPTHYAVALKYREGVMRAPQVVAKGTELVAKRIRELAEQYQVPTLEAPPLARSLYRHAEIGDEIPSALYTAVAQVLAYVHHLRRYRQHGGVAPKAPVAIEVPAELDVKEASA